MIESSQNEAIKILRRVRRTRGAEAVLEGPHLVLEALRLGLRLQPVVATEEFLGSAVGQEVGARLPRPPLVAAARILEQLADADSPRGLLAVCSLPRTGLEGVTPRPPEIWLYLDRIQDPGNLGALARVAEGLGAAGLVLSPGCADPNHSRALRASAGSLLRVPVAVHAEAAATAERFRAEPAHGASAGSASRRTPARCLWTSSHREAAPRRSSSRSARRAPGSPQRLARSWTPP